MDPDQTAPKGQVSVCSSGSLLFAFVRYYGAYVASQTMLYMQRLIKPSLQFLIFCVFFVSKGNLLDFHFTSLQLVSSAVSRL